ncbi:ATP-binding cassette domain-containing protein [Metabacillus bambusae]|uniref:ATP-binding cassette domain-containing protein n=1 Tax=Metabacillus bambusae TaxID=2795218 RepID=A0ABS3N3L4_9BACI|nr:ATP-binding cassette domain-containing protein [Metabacillus bambusae]MBO1512823.1 ATP-binding cassette domain-containing protein [Metabacillus bambusae]
MDLTVHIVQNKEFLKERQLKVIEDQLGLIGPNSAGKTSLIRCLMNLMHIDSGEIRLFGKTNLKATNERRKSDLNYFYEDHSIEFICT